MVSGSFALASCHQAQTADAEGEHWKCGGNWDRGDTMRRDAHAVVELRIRSGISAGDFISIRVKNRRSNQPKTVIRVNSKPTRARFVVKVAGVLCSTPRLGVKLNAQIQLPSGERQIDEVLSRRAKIVCRRQSGNATNIGVFVKSLENSRQVDADLEVVPSKRK